MQLLTAIGIVAALLVLIVYVIPGVFGSIVRTMEEGTHDQQAKLGIVIGISVFVIMLAIAVCSISMGRFAE